MQWGDTIQYPFAGGFNNPQFSSIDLNGDGIQDLFVFERSTNKVYTFINKGIAGKPSYVYAPQYRHCFPPHLTGWVLLRDYNCDGKADIFTSLNNSFCVYRNDYTPSGGLKFTFVKAFDQNFCYIIGADIPAISDVDGDGDLDILTFDPPGMYMYYYKNLSEDSFGNCDSLQFVLDQHCWGSFKEDFFTCSITLGDTASPCRLHTIIRPPDLINKGEQPLMHPGNASVATLDLNGDGKKEIIIGPQVCSNAVMLTNCSIPVLDSMVQQNNLYPDNIHPIHFHLFPAIFYEDVNNDGRKDLIAAPNRNASEDTASVWYYKDTSSTLIPKFTFQKKTFLQEDMIDVGEGANPVFFDYNGDSLMDLIVGNNYYYDSLSLSSSPASLSLYQNAGTKQSPAFKLLTRDFANISTLNLNGVYPAFGDLDGDGDEDMIIGESNGNLYYFTNTAGVGNPAVFSFTGLVKANDTIIDVGEYSAPQIVDVNCDGKLDLLVGERSGTIKYYENNGTVSQPLFKTTPASTEFGGIDVTPVCCTGYAVPFLTTDSVGHYQLLVGTESDSIYSYSNIDNNLNGTFLLTDSDYARINEGQRATVSGADIDHDGIMDLVVGNYAGGITLFKGHQRRIDKICKVPVDTLPFSISAYPNPVSESGYLTVHITGLKTNDYAEITIYNVLGQKVYTNQPSAIFNDWNISVPVYRCAAGLYILKVNIPSRIDNPHYSLKFIVTN